MEKAILLAVAASLCTAMSSVCQRKGARSSQTAAFDAGLVVRLARKAEPNPLPGSSAS